MLKMLESGVRFSVNVLVDVNFKTRNVARL